ncbi:MAG: HMG-box domain-containing protein, partial [Flavobacteriales bacterium]|nr:HMG-box domain-containing protein [Flavobacteriales bacterium]
MVPEEFIMTDNIQDKIKEFVQNNFKSKNTKKKKDPAAPKKNKSSYLFYCAENRKIIKQKNPDAKFGEVAKLVSAEWKKCKDKNGKEYKKYLQLANKDKERYQLEWIEYKPSEGFEKKKKKNSEKKIKGKRNGYILYCNENREKVKKSNPDKKGKEITKLLATLWKQEKAEESEEWKKFTELAKQDKERYDREKSESESEDVKSDSDDEKSEKSDSDDEKSE